MQAGRVIVGNIRRPRATGLRLVDVAGFEPEPRSGAIGLELKESQKLHDHLDKLSRDIRIGLVIVGIIAAFGLGALAVSLYMTHQARRDFEGAVRVRRTRARASR